MEFEKYILELPENSREEARKLIRSKILDNVMLADELQKEKDKKVKLA